MKFKINDVLTEVVVKKLDYGDYGCVLKNGHEVPYFFERKALSDLFSTFSNKKNYLRIKKEFKRARENSHKIIVIVEGDIGTVLKGCSYSMRSGIGLFRQLQTILWRYSILTMFFSSRKDMTFYVYEFFFSYAKWYYENGFMDEMGNRDTPQQA